MRIKTSVESLMSLCDALGEFGEIKPRAHYQGSNHYGSGCVGFSVSDEIGFTLVLGKALSESDEPDLPTVGDLLDGGYTESLGKGVIVYFPHWVVDFDYDNATWEGYVDSLSD